MRRGFLVPFFSAHSRKIFQVFLPMTAIMTSGLACQQPAKSALVLQSRGVEVRTQRERQAHQDFQHQLQRVQILQKKKRAREEALQARRWMQEKSWAQALVSLQKALSLDPELSSAEADLIQVYRAMNLQDLAREREQRRSLAPSGSGAPSISSSPSSGGVRVR